MRVRVGAGACTRARVRLHATTGAWAVRVWVRGSWPGSRLEAEADASLTIRVISFATPDSNRLQGPRFVMVLLWFRRFGLWF